jgi:hypothetical protein
MGTTHAGQSLLELARVAVIESRATGASPEETEQRLLAAWSLAGHPPVASDDRFWPDPVTGVEALAFLVGDKEGRSAGIVLRLPGEYPDSFEAVPIDPTQAPDPAAVRAQYFGSGDGR